MGKIKKILENELVGGTQTTDVYPVTSVKAVYDENNERLDHILNRRGTVNISTNYNDDHTAEVLTLAQAIAKVPSKDRVLGFQGRFLTENGWVTYQFNGNSVSDWSNQEYWSLLSDSTNMAQELGTSEDVAISQKATTGAIRRYSGGFPVKSAASTVEEFANGILSCKIVPKFSLDVEGLSDFRLSAYSKSPSSYILVGGFYYSGGWYKTIQFTGSISSLIEGKYILFRNNPNDDWGQCYILADVTNFPIVAPGIYPTTTFYTEDVVSPYHPYLDFAIRTLIDRPDIDSLLEQMDIVNKVSYLIEINKNTQYGISFYGSQYVKKYSNDNAGLCSYVPVKKGDTFSVIITPFIKYDENIAFPGTTFIQVNFSKSIGAPDAKGVTTIVNKRHITSEDYKYGQVIISINDDFVVEEDGYVQAFILVGDRPCNEGNAAFKYLNFGKSDATDKYISRWYRQSTSPTATNYPSWMLFSVPKDTNYDYQYQIPLVLQKKSHLLYQVLENLKSITTDTNDILELNEYLSRKFVSSTNSIIKPFTDTIIEVYVLAKFDTSDTNGLFRFNNWSSLHNISGGIYKDGNQVHTVSINKTDVEIGGLTLWYGENEYFQVALLGDDSKWVTPELGTYPSFQVKLDKVSKPVHPTIWSAINKRDISILDANSVKESVDYAYTEHYGNLLDLSQATLYTGDNTGLCQYVRLATTTTKVSTIETQFYKVSELRKGTKLMVGIFDSESLVNPTDSPDLFTVVNRDLQLSDFVNNQLIISLDDVDIAAGSVVQVVIFTGKLSTVSSGVRMKYLNFGKTEPEFKDELSAWYRQSDRPTEEVPIPRSWNFFGNSGTYAYQYQIPLILKDNSTYTKLKDRVSALEESYLPKFNTVQEAEDNSNYGSYYDNSHWKILQDNGCRVLYAVTRSQITFNRIYTTLCQSSSIVSNKECKLRVYVLDRQVTTSDLRGEKGFILEKSINPYTDLPTRSNKAFYAIDLPDRVTVGANKTISVVLFDPDDTLESGIAPISSWVYKGDEEYHDSLQLVYRCSAYNYDTQVFSLGYFSYTTMVTYNNYIGNIEPIFVIIGESGDTLRRDIDSNSQRIAKLEESGDTSKFTSRSILPATLHAAVGLEFNLYYDGFNLLPDYGKGEPSWMFNIQSEIESQWKALNYRSYQRTMQSSDIGKHTLTIDYYNNKNQKFSTESPDERFTVGLKVVDNVNPSTQKRILIIGDSTNEGGNVANRIYKNFHEEATGGIAPIMLGTRSDSTKTWRHEARTEKTYNMFANGETVIRVDFNVPEGFTEDDIVTANPSPYYNIGGANVYLRHLWHLNGDGTGYAIGYNNSSVDTSWTGTATKISGAASMPSSIEVTRVQRLSGWSPFKNNEGVGTLDFRYYRTVILGLEEDEKIDLMLSDLGINDIYTGNKTQTDINNIVNNAKKLIDAYLADGNGKFAICYPKSRSSAIADSDRRHYPMRIDMQSLREALVKTFDNGAYNENVLICGSGMQIDRWYGYPLAVANVASRISIQETKPTEGVHPSDPGYQQIGDAMTATIWAVLQ